MDEDEDEEGNSMLVIEKTELHPKFMCILNHLHKKHRNFCLNLGVSKPVPRRSSLLNEKQDKGFLPMKSLFTVNQKNI